MCFRVLRPLYRAGTSAALLDGMNTKQIAKLASKWTATMTAAGEHVLGPCNVDLADGTAVRALATLHTLGNITVFSAEGRVIQYLASELA